MIAQHFAIPPLAVRCCRPRRPVLTLAGLQANLYGSLSMTTAAQKSVAGRYPAFSIPDVSAREVLVAFLTVRSTCRKSMWQFGRAATSIFSGSTASFTADLPTTCGDAEAGTMVPPSKVNV